MAENRIPREVQNREQDERPKQWSPPELLPQPIRQPGYDYRYVRVSINNEADPRNISASRREGWEPVRAEEQPEMFTYMDPNSAHKDTVVIGGLMLCKRPAEMTKQRSKHYAKQSNAQSEAVDNNLMRQSDARMPLFSERKSTSSRGFGKGS